MQPWLKQRSLWSNVGKIRKIPPRSSNDPVMWWSWSKTPKTDAFADECWRLCQSCVWSLQLARPWRLEVDLAPGCAPRSEHSTGPNLFDIYIYMFFFNIIFWFRPILILFFFTLSTTSVKKELIWGKTHDGERRRGPIRKLWTYTLAILSSCITGWAKRPASWTGNWRRERGDQGRVSALLLFFFGGPFI